MLKFLIDENLRNRAIWQAIVDWQTNLAQLYPLDAIRVGQSPGPPAGTSDEDLLEFCAAQNRILVSLDKDTLSDELAKRLEAGNDSPGIILLHGAWSAGDLVEMLALVSHACEPAELANQFCWLTLTITSMPRVIYSPRYNISLFGLERLHPFDSQKYGRVWRVLRKHFGTKLTAMSVRPKCPASREELLLVHSESYLTRLRDSLLRSEGS